MKHLILWAAFSLYVGAIFAQNKASISGSIKDARTGELMIGATVQAVGYPDLGAVSNEYGFYSISLPLGAQQLIVNYLGYEPQTIDIQLEKDTQLDIQLQDVSQTIQEIVVSSKAANQNISSTQMSVAQLDVKEISQVPVLFGEKDVLKTLQLLPGIKAASDGNAGFYVRGGGIDQNLVLLDEANVYNPSHFLGFFSVFNSDAIKNVQVYKGGMPAQYGGRLSSVLDIKMKEGNNQDFSVSGGLGLISSRLTVEGPIQENKSSFMVSGRRTYADQFLKLSKDSTLNGTKLYFYDLNLKTNYQLGEKDRIFLSGYFGKDRFSTGENFNFQWGNATGTLRWNHIFNPQLFANTALIFSDYQYNVAVGSGSTEFNISSAIRDWNLRHDYQLFANQHNWRFGLNLTHHTFVPGNISRETEGENTGPASTNISNRYALESGLYVSDEFSLSSKLKVSAGLRFSMFNVLGPGTFYTYNETGIAVDSSTFGKGEVAKTYVGLEPRLSFNYQLSDTKAVKWAYARTQQYVQLLSSSTSTAPTDIWIPASPNVKPQIADQISAGYFQNFADNRYEFSIESYYKWMQNQVDYKPGAQLRVNQDVEAELLFGKGWSYGVELFLKKKTGRFTGWLGYTWSKTERKFAEINQGEPFPAFQDRTHDISIVGIYDLSERWNVSATWVYSTGSAVTFPSGKYYLEGRLVNYYTERNGYRMPAYHRLDLALNYYIRKGTRTEQSLNLGFYNAYNRKNAYQINFETKPGTLSETEAVRTALFGIVPSITWNFKW